VYKWVPAILMLANPAMDCNGHPPDVLMRLCKHEKMLYWGFYKIIPKMHVNLKRPNRVYIVSSKHTYRPMQVRTVALHLFLAWQNFNQELVLKCCCGGLIVGMVDS